MPGACSGCGGAVCASTSSTAPVLPASSFNVNVSVWVRREPLPSSCAVFCQRAPCPTSSEGRDDIAERLPDLLGHLARSPRVDGGRRVDGDAARQTAGRDGGGAGEVLDRVHFGAHSVGDLGRRLRVGRHRGRADAPREPEVARSHAPWIEVEHDVHRRKRDLRLLCAGELSGRGGPEIHDELLLLVQMPRVAEGPAGSLSRIEEPGGGAGHGRDPGRGRCGRRRCARGTRRLRGGRSARRSDGSAEGRSKRRLRRVLPSAEAPPSSTRQRRAGPEAWRCVSQRSLRVPVHELVHSRLLAGARLLGGTHRR